MAEFIFKIEWHNVFLNLMAESIFKSNGRMYF